jgi:hypothetical protein
MNNCLRSSIRGPFDGVEEVGDGMMKRGGKGKCSSVKPCYCVSTKQGGAVNEVNGIGRRKCGRARARQQ